MHKPLFYFYCDEAGHLGYSANSSDNEEAISLIAGLIADQYQKKEIELFCENLATKYQPNNQEKKFHIADIDQSQQENIRKDVFLFIKNNNIKIAYSAIYFSALSAEYEKTSKEHDLSTLSMKEQDIGISRLPSVLNKRAHAETFYHFYLTATCFAIQSVATSINTMVITDYIDDKIFEELKIQINRLHSLSPQQTLFGSRYSYEEKSTSKFSVSISSSASSDPRLKLVQDSTGDITRTEEKYSIIADIITNSIFHYLKKYSTKSNFGRLNCLDAINDHPLSDQIIGLSSTSLDNRYIHPNNRIPR